MRKSLTPSLNQLSVEGKVHRLAGSRSRELAHVCDPWWGNSKIVMPTPRLSGKASNDKSVFDNVAASAEIRGMVHDLRKGGV